MCKEGAAAGILTFIRSKGPMRQFETFVRTPGRISSSASISAVLTDELQAKMLDFVGKGVVSQSSIAAWMQAQGLPEKVTIMAPKPEGVTIRGMEFDIDALRRSLGVCKGDGAPLAGLLSVRVMKSESSDSEKVERVIMIDR